MSSFRWTQRSRVSPGPLDHGQTIWSLLKLNNCCVLMKYTQVIRSAFYIFFKDSCSGTVRDVLLNLNTQNRPKVANSVSLLAKVRGLRLWHRDFDKTRMWPVRLLFHLPSTDTCMTPTNHYLRNYYQIFFQSVTPSLYSPRCSVVCDRTDQRKSLLHQRLEPQIGATALCWTGWVITACLHAFPFLSFFSFANFRNYAIQLLEANF